MILLCDCEISANLRISFVSSSTVPASPHGGCAASCPHHRGLTDLRGRAVQGEAAVRNTGTGPNLATAGDICRDLPRHQPTLNTQHEGFITCPPDTWTRFCLPWPFSLFWDKKFDAIQACGTKILFEREKGRIYFFSVEGEHTFM